MATVAELEKQEKATAAAHAKAAEALRQGRAAAAAAGEHFPSVLETVKGYGAHWTKEQQQALAKELGLVPATANKKAAAKPKSGKAKSKAPALPVYQLDTGETCAAAGKFTKGTEAAFNAAIAKAGGKRENLPAYPNPKAPKAAAKPAGK